MPKAKRSPAESTEEKPKLGRPSSFTEEIGIEFCERIALGESVRQICMLPEMPEERTIYRWLLKNETFCQQYTRAREFQTAKMEQDILEIADDSTNDWLERETARGETVTVLNDEAVQRSKLRIASRQWLMGKLKPKKYGDRLEVDQKVTGEIEHTHTFTDEQRKSLMAKKRLAMEQRGKKFQPSKS